MHEFELINLIKEISLAHQNTSSSYVTKSIGDDAAVLKIPNDHELVVSTDTLVDGVHFDSKLSAFEIGHKSLAVNLSDIAAMGAQPVHVTLNLTLPSIDRDWVEAFLNGFIKLATKYDLELVGGDLTKGPLSITVTAAGIVQEGASVLRSGANPGDGIYLSGPIGEAAFILNNYDDLIDTSPLHLPEPHIDLGLALQAIASSMIDLSDGLSSDLNHILQSSQCGALIQATQLPLGKSLQSELSFTDAVNLALKGGDDYVLCFTVPEAKEQALNKLKLQFTDISKIGVITEDKQFLVELENETQVVKQQGYNHFNE